MGKNEKKRIIIQALWSFISNSYLIGFAKGKLYTESLKSLCVPGLNCYSCPGTLGSCPIGLLQAVIRSPKYQMAFYIFDLMGHSDISITLNTYTHMNFEDDRNEIARLQVV